MFQTLPGTLGPPVGRATRPPAGPTAGNPAYSLETKGRWYQASGALPGANRHASPLPTNVRWFLDVAGTWSGRPARGFEAIYQRPLLRPERQYFHPHRHALDRHPKTAQRSRRDLHLRTRQRRRAVIPSVRYLPPLAVFEREHRASVPTGKISRDPALDRRVCDLRTRRQQHLGPRQQPPFRFFSPPASLCARATLAPSARLASAKTRAASAAAASRRAAANAPLW